MIVDAVVVHHHNPRALAVTIAHLLAGARQPRRVVVVDNASTDGPPPVDDDRVRVVDAGVNGGYGYAVNVGVEALLADPPDAVLALTHETVVEHDCLARLVETLDHSGSGSLVGPLLTDNRFGGDLVWSAGGDSTWSGRPRHRLSGRPVADVAPQVVDVEWLDGAALLMTVQTWVRVGGFDEGYFLYQEDVDYSRRVRDRGGRVVCDRRARAAQGPGNRTGFQALRNGYYYHRRWSSPARRSLWLADELARTLVRRRGTVTEAVAGLRAGVHWYRQASAIVRQAPDPGSAERP